jgi:tetratricopeptide (TPR) repeat protein
MLGLVAFWRGDFAEARTRCERALDVGNASPDPSDFERLGDGRTYASSFLAVTMWQLGEVERARELIDWATTRANEIGHIGALADVLFWKSYLEVWRGDPPATLSAVEALEAVTRKDGLVQFLTEAELHSGWARGRINDPMAGAAQIRRALTAFVDQGVKINLGFYTGLLAQLEAETLGVDSALGRIDEAFRLSERVEHRCSVPFLHRLRGDILLKRDPANPASAEDAYRTAIAIAKQQGARSYELLASFSLAKLYGSTDRPADAHAVLAAALEGFAPTPEMPEIAEAQSVLAALAETDEVKVEAARRQRLGQLRVAYGHALIATRGYGAPETTEAFAAARESAHGDNAAPERLAADYGLWVGSYVRGELPSMRRYAAAFVGDVEARPDSPAAGVAQRVLGATHWFAGEYVDARDHLERALALFEPARDDDLAFRFGQDPGVAAMFYLAFTLWPLGDIERAVSLVDAAQARIAGLPHVQTRAYGKSQGAMFELMRGDLSRTLPNAAELAVELARLARASMICRCGEPSESFSRVWRGLKAMRLEADSRTCVAASICCANRASCCSMGC